MNYLGKYESIGEAWIAVLKVIYNHGEEVVTSEEIYIEYKGITIDVTATCEKDIIIEKYSNRDDIDWMISNFEEFQNVSALNNAHSYASRLYRYAGMKNQVEWVVDKFKKNPIARSATITTFEPLIDDHYIPCVSMLDFDMNGNSLDVYVYARALDFGRKAHANLICIQKLLKDVSQKLECKCGTIHLICKSAHVYSDSYKQTKYMLEQEGALIDKKYIL